MANGKTGGRPSDPSNTVVHTSLYEVTKYAAGVQMRFMQVPQPYRCIYKYDKEPNNLRRMLVRPYH